MVTILSTTRTCDGWDVLTDYRPQPFHSTVERADWQPWVDEIAADLEAANVGVQLDQAKQSKIAAIDQRTEQLLIEGFSFGGKQFTLARGVQATWLGLAIGAQSGLLSYPIQVGAEDNTALELADAQTVGQFVATGLMTGQQIVQGGAAVKAAVQGCETVEAVNAVVDPR